VEFVKIYLFLFCVLVCLLALGFEFRALCLQGRCLCLSYASNPFCISYF
jgi:hypothetical protein